MFDLQNIGLKKFAPAIAVTLVVAAFVSVLALYFLVIVPAQSEPTDTAGADPAETATQVTQPPTDAGGDTLVSPPVEPEPEPPSEPAPEPEPEPITLHADDYSVSVPALTGAALNPLLRAYDDGTPGEQGVDVDRDTLQIVSVSNSNRGAVETSADSKNLIYRPTEGVNERTENYDSVEYTVQTAAGDIVKIATGVITINLETEDYEQNSSELNALLDANFSAEVDAAIIANFRFADGEISNEDLSIVKYFVDNDFSDESVQIIMDLPEELSPLRSLDEHSLRKLLGVNNLFSNENFLNSVHGPDSPVKEWQWDEDYAEILRQASFIIPSLVEVIEPLKTINYDKLDLDELFERLDRDYTGLVSRYTGLFSRGQTYNPFYVTTGNATQDQLSFARENDLLVVNDMAYNFSFEPFGFIGTENAVKYYENLGKVNLNLNENVINFSLLSLLDEFGYQFGPSLSNGSVFDIAFLMDKFEEKTRGSSNGSVGTYSFVLSWENGSYGNGERSNVYNAVREILGSSYSGGELETVFRVIDWLLLNTTHFGGRPHVSEYEYNYIEEEELFHSLPNPAFIPSFYTFIPKEVGGVNLSGSPKMAGDLTSGLRVLGIPAEQFRASIIDPNGRGRTFIFDNYLEPFYRFEGLRAPPFYNIGSVMFDGVPWFYNGNFPLGAGNVRFGYQGLIPHSDFTPENLSEASRGLRDHTDYFYRRTELQSEYESIFAVSD